MSFVLKVLFALLLIALVLAFLRSWQEEHSDTQKTFAAGKIPSGLNGFYKGSVNAPIKLTWLGKKFDAASSTGINIFDDNGTTTEKFPFKTYTSSSSLAIDYDVPENPFWARTILDQLVETAPGKYLGKLTVRVIPGYPFTLGFFKLEK